MRKLSKASTILKHCIKNSIVKCFYSKDNPSATQSVLCEFEGNNDQLQHHYDEDCAVFPVKCSNACSDVIMPRSSIAEHLLSCRLHEVVCPTDTSICSWKGQREKISEHVEVCPAVIVRCSSIATTTSPSPSPSQTVKSMSSEMDLVMDKDSTVTHQDQVDVAELVQNNADTSVNAKPNQQQCADVAKVLDVDTNVAPSQSGGDVQPIISMDVEDTAKAAESVESDDAKAKASVAMESLNAAGSKRKHDVIYNCEGVCEWQGFRRDLESHENECPYIFIECPHACRGKDDEAIHRLRRGEVDEHLRRCVRAPIDCPLAKNGCEWQGCREDVKSHVDNDCTEVVVKCTNHGCEFASVEMTRKCLQKHLQVCLEEVVSCSLSSMGCAVSLPRKVLAKHMQEAMTEHYQLMFARDEQRQKEVENLQKQREHEMKMLKKEYDEKLANLQAQIRRQDIYARGHNVIWKLALVTDKRKPMMNKCFVSDAFSIGGVSYYLQLEKNEEEKDVPSFDLFLYRKSRNSKNLKLRYCACVRAPDGSKLSTPLREQEKVWDFDDDGLGWGWGWGHFLSASDTFIADWVSSDGFLTIALSVSEIHDYRDCTEASFIPDWNFGAPLSRLRSEGDE